MYSSWFIKEKKKLKKHIFLRYGFGYYISSLYHLNRLAIVSKKGFNIKASFVRPLVMPLIKPGDIKKEFQ